MTLDPDTEELIRKEIARRRMSFKRILNDAIRRGLGGPSKQPADIGVKVLSFDSAYQPGVDRLRLQQLSDDMEIAGFAAKEARRT